MLYQITNTNTRKVSYLLGTMHTQSAAAYTYFEKARYYLTGCEYFVSEINLADPVFQDVNKLFQLPDQKDLTHYFTNKQLHKIRNQLTKSFDVDILDFINMQPIFTMNHILSLLPDISFPKPLDFALFEEALTTGLSIDGLESYEDQINIITGLNVEDQILQLKKLGTKPEKFTKKVKKLAEHYRVGDIKAIYHKSRAGLLRYRTTLLKNRNISMGHNLNVKASENKCFFAVGAAHLYGKYGLISIVKKHGFKIKRLV